MISKSTIYLNEDRSQAVPEGHKDAKFLLVREGHEVDDKALDKYDGAVDLATTAQEAEESEDEADARNQTSGIEKPRHARKAKK